MGYADESATSFDCLRYSSWGCACVPHGKYPEDAGKFRDSSGRTAGPTNERREPHSKKSEVIVSFEWIGDAIEYSPGPGEDLSHLGPIPKYFGKVGYQVHGDTFPMTWADDDQIYASAGDPNWGGKEDGLDVEEFSGTPPQYTITRVNPMSDYKGFGGKGEKPSGMICVNGVLYLAFQNLLGVKPPAHGTKSQHGSDAMIVSSRDHGKTWTPAMKDIKAPMFPGNLFGGPAFVNTGRNNANAPDRMYTRFRRTNGTTAATFAWAGYLPIGFRT